MGGDEGIVIFLTVCVNKPISVDNIGLQIENVLKILQQASFNVLKEEEEDEDR